MSTKIAVNDSPDEEKRIKSMVQLEYKKDDQRRNSGSRMSGMAMSENGDAKVHGIDETFGFL
mgnify:CR=1 FL=1